MDDANTRLEDVALAPLRKTGPGYYFLIAGLLLVIAGAVYAYITQVASGLSVTGMSPTVNKVAWGVYIINFVFFIGISHAGTLISDLGDLARQPRRVAPPDHPHV